MKIKHILLFLMAWVSSMSLAYAQQTVVASGSVMDEKGELLIGVSISVKEVPSMGAITDIDGRFKIGGIKAGHTLVISYVGYDPQEIKMNKSNERMRVVLKESSNVMDEVVITASGKVQKKINVTGAITGVEVATLKTPATSISNMLGGRVPGIISVTRSGEPGKDFSEFWVRGISTFGAGQGALVLIDGVEGNLNTLDPEDIESFSILKDASSTAVYGVRGANGVIIITTKKAKVGQTRVNINGSFGFKSVPNQIEMVDAAGFKELYNEQLRNEGNPEFDFTGWNGNTNWQDEIFQTGFITNNNVSITGASEKHSFYLGAGYAYEQGNIKNEKYSKITLSVSNEYKLTDNFRVGFQFNGARILPADTKTVTTAVRATPVATVFNDQYGLYTTLPEFQKAQMNNPMVDVDLKANTTRAENYRGSGNVYAEWDFLKHFQFKAMFSMDYASNNSRKFTPIIQVYDASAEGNIVTLGDGKTGVSQAKQTEMKTQSDYLLTYTNTWGDHSLTATAGFTTYYNKLENLGAARAQGVGLVIPDNPDKWYVSIGDAGTSTNESTQWERATVSMLGRILYNYKGRYLFNGSFRRDGSSAFSYTGNQWQNFYSVGAGWLISEEEFMKDITWLDMLKLKGSWGTLGNQNLDKAYPAEPLLSNAYSAVFGTPSAIYPGYQLSYLPNATLRWEKVEAWEVGAEANFFRNRLHLEGVYYKKTTKDLLAEVPGISGTVPGIGNLGSIENKGIELAINWRDQIGDWNYSIGGNLTTIKNKVLSLVQEGYSIISGDKSQSYTMAGFPIGYFYGYKVEGVYQNQAEIDNSPKNTLATVTPGDLKFVDVDGNGEITPADRTMIGDPTPDVTYGINFSVGYKNWELGVDMMGQAGNEIYRTWDNYNWSQFNFMKQRLNRWHGEGTSNSQPLLNMKHTINNLNSEYYIEDGSFFRIRNVQLAYNFDKTLLSRIGVQALKLYANIQNLKTWKHNTGYTPELGGTAIAFGVDNGSYPMPVVYTFGFNLTF